MKIQPFFIAFFIIVGCSDFSEKANLQEPYKNELIFQKDIISENYLKELEFRDNRFEKEVDSINKEVIFSYENRIFKDNRQLGGFVSSTYYLPNLQPNEVRNYYEEHIAGFKFEMRKPSNYHINRTFNFELPFNNYEVYAVFDSNKIKRGYQFIILKDKSFVSISVIGIKESEINLEKLVDKVRKI